MPVIKTTFKDIERCTEGGVCDYCRMLLEDNHPADARLEVYRGSTLCLTVSSVGEGAKLRNDGHDFVKWDGRASRRGKNATPSLTD